MGNKVSNFRFQLNWVHKGVWQSRDFDDLYTARAFWNDVLSKDPTNNTVFLEQKIRIEI